MCETNDHLSVRAWWVNFQSISLPLCDRVIFPRDFNLICIDPLDQPKVNDNLSIIIFTSVHLAKQKQIPSNVMMAASSNVGLAVWIIDDSFSTNANKQKMSVQNLCRPTKEHMNVKSKELQLILLSL